jgi:hypothetical protein
MATLKDYRAVWNTLKTTGHASITVSDVAMKNTVNGVLKAKAAENVARRNSGLMYWSKLVIVRTRLTPTLIRVDFSFLYQTKV